MLSLHYIIIGALEAPQRSYLEMHLTENRQREERVQLVTLDERTLLDFPAEESILISEDRGELVAANALDMATIGYLKSAREQNIINAEKVECFDDNMCTNTDMWAEGFEEVDFTFIRRVYERHHQIPWTILVTERCVVKEFSMEYLDALFALYAGEGMTTYIEPLFDYEEEKEYQKSYIQCMYGFYGYGMWIVCDRQSGKLIGRAGLEHREALGGELELGYAIGVPYQRKGYAQEVCRAILAYAREHLEQTSVCCLIEEGNTASEHLAEKLGFSWTEEKILDGKRMKKYVLSFL